MNGKGEELVGRQTLLTEKQPADSRLIPLLKDEVAEERDCIPLPEIESPPLNVEVARFETFNDPRVEVAA